MNTNKLPHVFFCLAVIAALVSAAIPAPAFALAAPARSTTRPQLQSTTNAAPSVLVCRAIGFWLNHRWVKVLICHKVPNPG